MHANAVTQRLAKGIQFDFEDIALLGLEAVRERQRGGTEEVHMHVARTQELGVFEMVVFEVFQAVAHVCLAAEKLLLPDHLMPTADTAGDRKSTRLHSSPEKA